MKSNQKLEFGAKVCPKIFLIDTSLTLDEWQRNSWSIYSAMQSSKQRNNQYVNFIPVSEITLIKVSTNFNLEEFWQWNFY